MNQKKCFLVFGPESSGTRLLTRALINMGCAGDGDHVQQFDKHPITFEAADCSEFNFEALENVGGNFVWRRSFPHGVRHATDDERWPRVAEIIEAFLVRGIACHVLVTVRDVNSMIASQVARKGITAEQSRRNIQRTYLSIFKGISSFEKTVSFTMSGYESIILNGESALSALAKELGLEWNFASNFHIVDGNKKYYPE